MKKRLLERMGELCVMGCFQLREGFRFCGIMKDYIPEDHDSCGNAALIAWINTEFNPMQPSGLHHFTRTSMEPTP